MEEINEEARRCGITVEQLIKRCIVDAMERDSNAESMSGETMEDFLVKNGVLTRKK